MANTQLKVEVGFAWWLRPWLAALVFFCVLTGGRPDMVKLEAVIRRAVRLRCR